MILLLGCRIRQRTHGTNLFGRCICETLEGFHLFLKGLFRFLLRRSTSGKFKPCVFEFLPLQSQLSSLQ